MSTNENTDSGQVGVGGITLAFGAALLLGWKLHKWTTGTSSFGLKDWLTVRHKLVLVVRGDLPTSMVTSAGQVAAHCASASILAFKTASKQTPLSTFLWKLTGQTKVVVRTKTGYEFTKLAEEASKRSIASSLIKDSASKPSSIVLAIGPGPACLVDQVTGHLKLVR